MPSYLMQVAYGAEGLAAIVKNPQDRTEAVRKPIEKLGGKLSGAWFTFGDYDVAVILEMPDNVSAAAFALAISAGGSLKAVKTTPLLTLEEGLKAMELAATSGYEPVAIDK